MLSSLPASATGLLSKLGQVLLLLPFQLHPGNSDMPFFAKCSQTRRLKRYPKGNTLSYMRVKYRSSTRPEGRHAMSVWQNRAHRGRPKQIDFKLSPHGAVLHCAAGTYAAHYVTVYLHQTRTCLLNHSAAVTPG